MCVQDVDAQCVLQFTLIIAAGCALHRRTSRVIHRSEWILIIFIIRFKLFFHKEKILESKVFYNQKVFEYKKCFGTQNNGTVPFGGR